MKKDEPRVMLWAGGMRFKRTPALRTPKTADRELWAVASTVLSSEGEDVEAFLVERIQSLMDAGDDAGVFTWIAIADRIKQLHVRPTGIEGRN